MLRLKKGVSVRGMRPEILLAVFVAHELASARYGHDIVITSCVDGKHGRGSLHYVGNAVDIRTRDWDPERRRDFAVALDEALGPEYDVVLEQDHLHIEYDPKEALNA